MIGTVAAGALVAQRTEQLPSKQLAAGSSPAEGTNFKAAGSSPAGGTGVKQAFPPWAR
jgi:hypothetical protein